jgi:hypothetical protein
MFFETEKVKISSAVTPTAGAAGTSEIDGTALDMTGFKSVLALVRVGTLSSGAVTSIKMQQSSDSGVADDWTDLAGTSQTIAQASDGDKTFYVDVRCPLKRYVRLVVLRATGNAVISSAHYLQYDPVSLPVTQGSNVSGEQWYAPAEGTA